MIKNIFLTGPPGSGKTSILLEVVEILKREGLRVSGITCPEVRESGRRVGFKIVNVSTGEEGILAWINPSFKGPRVGRYTVNLRDLDEIGSKTIEESVDSPDVDVVVIDEIGIMELKSKRFAQAVVKALNSQKFVLGVIHRKSNHPLLVEIRSREDTKIFEVTRTIGRLQKEMLRDKIAKMVLEHAGKN